MSRLSNVTLGLSLATIPFGTSLAAYTLINSSLVRFRASYNAKTLAHEDIPVGTLAPKSYLGTIVWIYRHEGVSGLFRGIVPVTLSAFVLGLAATVDTFYLRPENDHHRWDLGTKSFVEILGYIIAYPIISLPILVVTNRDIVRPYRRLTTNPVTSFRLPLTPQERRRPWLLYSIPGLFVTQMVTTGLFALEKNLSHRYFPDTSQGNPTSMNYWRVAVPRMVLLAAVMTPFNVIATRLTVQSDHSSDQSEKSLVDRSDTERSTFQSKGPENTTGLPSYTGMIDCAKRIIKEEGFRTLYRGWWIPS